MVSRVASMGTCTVTAQAVPGFHETNREAEVPVWNPRVVAWVQTNGSLPKVRTQTPGFVGWTMGSVRQCALMSGLRLVSGGYTVRLTASWLTGIGQ